MPRATWLSIAASAALLLVAMLLGVAWGTEPVSLSSAMSDPASLDRLIVIGVRLPRVLLREPRRPAAGVEAQERRGIKHEVPSQRDAARSLSWPKLHMDREGSAHRLGGKRHPYVASCPP